MSTSTDNIVIRKLTALAADGGADLLEKLFGLQASQNLLQMEPAIKQLYSVIWPGAIADAMTSFIASKMAEIDNIDTIFRLLLVELTSRLPFDVVVPGQRFHVELEKTATRKQLKSKIQDIAHSNNIRFALLSSMLATQAIDKYENELMVQGLGEDAIREAMNKLFVPDAEHEFTKAGRCARDIKIVFPNRDKESERSHGSTCSKLGVWYKVATGEITVRRTHWR